MSTIVIEKNSYGARHVYLSSGDGDDYPGCILSIALACWYVSIKLPQWVLRPEADKHIARSWDAATVARMGRDWYFNFTERRYGVSCSNNFLQVFFGRQSNDSSNEQSWCCFLPWGEWREVRFTLCAQDGSPWWTTTEDQERAARVAGASPFDAQMAAEKLVPKRSFLFTDFDGEVIEAVTHIEEREHRRGTKWCAWMGRIWRPRVRRSLSIRFTKEVGPRKTSWKGGTVGHGIELLPGELHEAAFRRYCDQGNRLTFQGAI